MCWTCSSAVAATCDALSITSLVARKLLGASFSLVRMCAGKPLLQTLTLKSVHYAIYLVLFSHLDIARRTILLSVKTCKCKTSVSTCMSRMGNFLCSRFSRDPLLRYSCVSSLLVEWKFPCEKCAQKAISKYEIFAFGENSSDPVA